MKEYLSELEQLQRPISEEQRVTFLEDLRQTHTDIDGRRDIPLDDIRIVRQSYFHQLQDLMLAKMKHEGLSSVGNLKGIQACFVKDGDKYLLENEGIDPEMKTLFELIFNVGTSADWNADRELVLSLHRIYWDLDEKVLRPWVNS